MTRVLAPGLGYSGLALIIAAGLYALALVSAESLLVQREAPAHADIIVVLGGDAPTRSVQAAKLWLEGKAPLILVSGYGDCAITKQSLATRGVDPAAIRMECGSNSTWENARFSQPILIDMRVNSAILVTSWFHSKRAVKLFRAWMPSIQWISIPTERQKSYWNLAFDPDGKQIVKEYAKTILYDLRTSIIGVASNGAAAKTSRLP